MALAVVSPQGSSSGGTVTSVTAADTSIVVGGTATDPTVRTGTLDVIATDHPPAAAVALNAKKITGLANGSASSDAAAFGQIPTALPPNGTAGGDLSGTYPNPAVKAITETSGPTDLVIGTVTDGQVLKRVGSTLVSAPLNAGTVTSVTAADTSIVVAGTGAAPTIATATLDVIAADHPAAADWSNNSHKITSLANGSSAQDAAAFGQIPTALPPNGAAGGDLAGTYANPTLRAGLLPLARGGQTWYYCPQGAIGTQIPVQNTLHSVPLWLPAGVTVDRIGVEVTLNQSSTNVRLGLYADSGFGYPGARLVDGGTVATTSTGNKEATVSVAITTSGLYWIAGVTQGGTTQPTMRAYNQPMQGLPTITTFTTAPGATNTISIFTVTGVSGTLPDPFGTAPLANGNVSCMRLYVRLT